MKPDPLSLAASAISTPYKDHSVPTCEPDLFLDGDRFMWYLSRSFESFDVATYSRSKSTRRPLARIDRLIYGLRQRCPFKDAKQVRYLENNHVKLFLCYTGPLVVAVYIGSQNLCHGTNLNLMYRVREEHNAPLKEFFERMWNASV